MLGFTSLHACVHVDCKVKMQQDQICFKKTQPYFLGRANIQWEVAMPVFDFQCSSCGSVFEALVAIDKDRVLCKKCGENNAKKRLSAPSFLIKKGPATHGIEKRIKDYLTAGKVSEAARFADTAASLVKSDKVKKIQEKLHQKTGK